LVLSAAGLFYETANGWHKFLIKSDEKLNTTMIRLTVTFFVLALVAGIISFMADIEPTAARFSQYAALCFIGLFLLSLLTAQPKNRHH
jgi:uncharacterized membrane protein YtjA (UPF0391 family)